MTKIKRLITLQRGLLVHNPVASVCSAARNRAGRMNRSNINRLLLPPCAPGRCAKFALRSGAILIQARLARRLPGARSPVWLARSPHWRAASLLRSDGDARLAQRLALVP